MIFLWFSYGFPENTMGKTSQHPTSLRSLGAGLRKKRVAPGSPWRAWENWDLPQEVTQKKTDINIKHIKKHTYIYIYNYIYIILLSNISSSIPQKKVSNKNPPSRPNQRQSPTVTLGAQTHRPRNWLSIRRDSWRSVPSTSAKGWMLGDSKWMWNMLPSGKLT